MVYSVVVGTPLNAQALHMLRSAPDVALVEASEPERIRRVVAAADALIIRDELPIDAALLDAATHLKVIGRAGVSLAGFDMERATARGIIVMNTPGINAVSTAEYTFALMLALVRRVLVGHQDLRRGEWTRESHVGMELYGKVLGLVGLGRVGRQVAERALAFGMVVIAYDPYVAESHLNGLRVKLVGLDEVIARSDVISLHCAPTPETQHVLDAEAFTQVKPGVWIVNAAHGEAVHERALAEALQDGRVAGAALDVFAQEPPIGSPLIGLANVIHTPHMGDSTAEAQRDVSIHIVRQVLDALRGVDYRNAVNMPFLQGSAFEAMQPYLNLAERIGALQHHLARGRIRRVAVEYKGDELEGMVKPLTVALLKGLLSPVLGDSVNYINAPLVAMERGIHVTQAKGLDVADYVNLVSCEVNWEGGQRQVISGALFNRREPHIVQIDEYLGDFVPSGVMLIFGSYDVPGVIGRVGTLMALHELNIASWRTGRSEKGGHTLSIVTLDHPLPDDLLEEFRALDFVRHATQVILP